MAQFNANVVSVQRPGTPARANAPATPNSASGPNFKKAVTDYVKNTDNLQHQSEQSITDMLSGKNQDINSVVQSYAKADMSFKLLVGVRNKMIEAYKETMRMQV